MDSQNLIVALLVGGSAFYAGLALMPQGWRLALVARMYRTALRLTRGRWPRKLPTLLAQPAGPCGGCGSCAQATPQATASQPLRFMPISRRP
jgi:hypothetical protein